MGAADLGPEAIEEFDHVIRAVMYTSSAVRQIDPALVPLSVFANIESIARNVEGEINAYVANRNNQHLKNANAHADALLLQAAQLPLRKSDDQLEILRESVTSFRRSAGQYMASVEKDAERLRGDMNALQSAIHEARATVEAQKARLDNAIAEFQRQFSQSESERRAEASRFNEEMRAELSNLLERQRSALAEFTVNADKTVTLAIHQARDELSGVAELARSRAADLVSDIASLRDQAQDLLHVIGSTGMAGEFQKAASSAATRTVIWQVVAGASLIGLIGFAIGGWVLSTDGSADWGAIGARIFVAVAFGFLAAFSSRQADRYHAAEVSARRSQLELSSIDPYLASLPIEMRHEVKRTLAERFFGSHTGARDEGEDPEDKTRLIGVSIEALKTAREAIESLTRRGG